MNYEGRPWQRLVKKSVDGSTWLHDVQARQGPDSKKQELNDEKAWTMVHPSTRNKKQHLRQPEQSTKVKVHGRLTFCLLESNPLTISQI